MLLRNGRNLCFLMVIRGGMLLLSGLADLGNDPGLVRLGEVLAGLAMAGFFAVNLLLFLLRERRGRPD